MALVMPFNPLPQVPAFRITLFYGPEVVEAVPKVVQCVFNVKKRSWKGGVQIVVALLESQVIHLSHSIHFEEWVKTVLSGVSEGERPDYIQRAYDLLGQQICAMKLQLAIQNGMAQENACVGTERFVEELNEVVLKDANKVKNNIVTEMDVQAWDM